MASRNFLDIRNKVLYIRNKRPTWGKISRLLDQRNKNFFRCGPLKNYFCDFNNKKMANLNVSMESVDDYDIKLADVVEIIHTVQKNKEECEDCVRFLILQKSKSVRINLMAFG
jgi:hypothetical protein